MTPATRRTVFLAPLGIWIIVTVVGLVSAGSLAAGTGAGADGHRAVRSLGSGLGYLVDPGQQVIRLKPGPAPFCWICGREQQDEALILDAAYRNGTWLYRAPAKDPDLTGYTAENAAAALALSRVVAFDFSTGAKLVVPEASTLEGKQAILEGKGLVADDAHKVTPAMLEQWPAVSMMREGCVIAQASLLGFLFFWLAGWGAWWAMNRRRGRALSGV